MLRRWREAQGRDIMIHTCESGHFVILGCIHTFFTVEGRREGGRKRGRGEGSKGGRQLVM